MSFGEGGYHDSGILGKIGKKFGEKALPVLMTLGLGGEVENQNFLKTEQIVAEDKEMTKVVKNNSSKEIQVTDQYGEILKTVGDELYGIRMSGNEKGEIRYFKAICSNVDYRLKIRNLIEKYSEKSGVPLDIAYSVAALESKFDNTLVNRFKATGKKSREITSVGIYQIRLEAASEVGLKKDKETGCDKRENLDKNIMAGMEILANYYEMFQDWPLALIAYSHGPAGVFRKLNSLHPDLTLNKRNDDFDEAGKNNYYKKLKNGELKIAKLFSLDQKYFRYAVEVDAIADLAHKYLYSE